METLFAPSLQPKTESHNLADTGGLGNKSFLRLVG
jgi:hypothetical protein